MALIIKNPEMERLAAEVAEMAGETKTEAIKRALEERKERLALQDVPGNRIARLAEVSGRGGLANPSTERARTGDV